MSSGFADFFGLFAFVRCTAVHSAAAFEFIKDFSPTAIARVCSFAVPRDKSVDCSISRNNYRYCPREKCSKGRYTKIFQKSKASFTPKLLKHDPPYKKRKHLGNGKNRPRQPFYANFRKY